MEAFIPRDMTPEALAEIQLKGLRWTLGHVLEHSAFYRAIYGNSVAVDDIRTLEDIRHLPFIDKEDLQRAYPLPLKSVDDSEIVRIHGSSGTTGKRKILCYTQRDIDVWADMFARCYELAGLTRNDRVHIAVGYGLWTAGVGFQLGCERFGAMAVPLGPANTEMHLDLLRDMQSTVLCATASMALLLAEEISRRNLTREIRLKTIILGAERHSQAMRERILQLTGASEIFDIYGLTELYGPGTGLDCSCHAGIHFWSDLFIAEIIDPVTLKPVPDGEEGELVITTLKKEASPLVRYRTHDITRIIPGTCACGLGFPRHDRIKGRSDDMFIFKAVNIYPSQVDLILGRIPGIGSEYQILLDSKENGRDTLTLRVERSPDAASTDDPALGVRISETLRRSLLVRADVAIVDYNTLPRTQKKSQRVFDRRNSGA